MTHANIRLSLPEKLRLRSRFSRWLKAPAVFAGEIADAQKQIELAEQPGWSMSVDRAGIPTAQPPANLRLTPREQKRFAARLANSTEEERKAFLAAMGAAKFRGFQIGVSADGKLQAKPPGETAKRIVHESQLSAAKKNQKFTNKFFGSSAFA